MLGDRFNAGKARWDLLPPGPLSEIVNVYTYGSKKYSDHNWRKGLTFSSTFASCCRHLFAWFSGEKRDPESGCHHLAHVAWNCLTLMEFEFKHTSKDPNPLDDRPANAAPIQPTTNIKPPPEKPNAGMAH